MPSIAAHITAVPGSGIRRIHEIALTMDDVISLAVGEPDVAVAPHIADAAVDAWRRDATNYTANGGIPELRSAIVEKLARDNNIHVDTERVWVTVGATQGLHQAMAITLSPGDEVLLPDPGYTTFTMNAHMLGARAVPYPLSPVAGFMPDVAELESLVTDRTRVMIVNSPSNPLGTVFPQKLLQELLDFAERHDLWIISDEVYEAFTWSMPHVSIASLDAENRVFSVFSLSKTYAMTGARVGYLVTPPGLADTMRSVQEATISCASEPGQFAALAAVTGSQVPVEHARKHYRANLIAATPLLASRAIRYPRPRGAFYLWIDVRHASEGDVAVWAESFLRNQRVSVAPGSAFGVSGEGWIRVSLASEPETLLTGLGRLPSPNSGG
ncbi:MAG: aminotransferase class I/II-fold pyridoxal phosphate-dependent enzyme [Salinibacterium sp.]|nr:aminotransferase class I/II-fold pyridoxal phosphate-dependent enzyme [Salinibacterium sp.]